MTSVRLFFAVGSVSALLAVAAGAFGAHALKTRLPPALFSSFEVGSRYHMYHALALLATAWAASRWPGSAVSAAGYLFIAGTILFSGSLYAMCLSGIRWLGAVTPLGGLAFLAGWACLAWAAWRREN